MGPPPPRWLVVIMTFFACIFAIPALVIAAPLACICFPCVWCCELCLKDPREERACTFNNIFGGCWIGWLLVFLMIVVVIPLTVVMTVIRCVFGLCGIEVCTNLENFNQQAQRQQQQQQPNANLSQNNDLVVEPFQDDVAFGSANVIVET